MTTEKDIQVTDIRIELSKQELIARDLAIVLCMTPIWLPIAVVRFGYGIADKILEEAFP